MSRLEMRGDMHLSTLRNMLEAMGGELERIARVPGRPARLTVPATASRRRKTERRRAA